MIAPAASPPATPQPQPGPRQPQPPPRQPPTHLAFSTVIGAAFFNANAPPTGAAEATVDDVAAMALSAAATNIALVFDIAWTSRCSYRCRIIALMTYRP